MQTLYVVSGFMRSGTSMMMKAIEAGGLPLSYSPEREELRERYSDEYYNPNEGGLYELSDKEFNSLEFPLPYKGTCVKALQTAVPRMRVVPGGIRVIFMRRDQEEIRQSYLAFFGKNLPQLQTEDFEERMQIIQDQILNRKDVLSLDVIWYRDVVNNPLPVFERLKENGWPIDPVLAASVVDPALCRYRLENLSIGVL